MPPLIGDPTTGYLLWRVATKWRAAVDRALAPLGLTHAQYSLLGSLYGLSRGGIAPSQRELADYAGLEPIFVSKLVRALEQAGVLSRTEHPDDPRAMQLHLTEHGMDIARRAIAVVRALHDDLTAPIGGMRGNRNRDLKKSLRALLDGEPGTGRPEANQEADTEHEDNRRGTMTPTSTPAPTPAPALTGQDIGEA
jgi:DNA-binding MarR family transcriptional regulator